MPAVHGRKVRTVERVQEASQSLEAGKYTVAYESRLLKYMLLKVAA